MNRSNVETDVFTVRPLLSHGGAACDWSHEIKEAVKPDSCGLRIQLALEIWLSVETFISSRPHIGSH